MRWYKISRVESRLCRVISDGSRELLSQILRHSDAIYYLSIHSNRSLRSEFNKNEPVCRPKKNAFTIVAIQ